MVLIWTQNILIFKLYMLYATCLYQSSSSTYPKKIIHLFLWLLSSYLLYYFLYLLAFFEIFPTVFSNISRVVIFSSRIKPFFSKLSVYLSFLSILKTFSYKSLIFPYWNTSSSFNHSNSSCFSSSQPSLLLILHSTSFSLSYILCI